MTFCETHWSRLLQAITDRGLEHLVARDGAQAARQFAEAVQAQALTASSFDPLMYVHMVIVGTVLDLPDAPAMDADLCPLCLVQLQQHLKAGVPSAWIAAAADAALAKARELKLVGLPA